MGFVYFEVGRYSEPQVPRTLFDERREFFAYTAGLFVGIALLVLYVLFTASLESGGLLGALLVLAGMLAVLELGQFLLGRSVYFGSDASLPFYVLGYRAGAAGLLGIGVASDYLILGAYTAAGLFGIVVTAVAFVLLLAGAGLQSTPSGPRDARRPGSLVRGLLLEVLGFLLLGFGALSGDVGTIVGALAVVGGSAGLYLRRRDEVLGQVRPPPSREALAEAPPAGGRFGRQDRKG